MEHIKRANKLWTADSLFLRPTLSIPISDDSDLKSPVYSSSSSQASSPSNGHKSLVKPVKISLKDSEELSFKSSNGSIDAVANSGIENGTNGQPSVASHKRDESIKDFLSRIDSSISRTKDQVMQQEDKLSSQHSESDLFQIGRVRQSPSAAYLHRHSLNSSRAIHNSDRGSSSSLASNGGLGDIPLVVTNTRTVKSSRRRLERKQDELFEL